MRVWTSRTIPSLLSSHPLTPPAAYTTFASPLMRAAANVVRSRLINDPTYEAAADRALFTLWGHRSKRTGLLGSAINIHSGRWVNPMTGLGAGVDSFFEYALKAYTMFGKPEYLQLFEDALGSTLRLTRHASLPIYTNVNMDSGLLANHWVDSLQANLPSVLVLNGNVEAAAVQHALHFAIWQRYGAQPERFNWRLKAADIPVYPLRPELAEATYMLYRATGNKYYQRVGAQLLNDLEVRAATALCTRVRGGVRGGVRAPN